MGCVPWKTAVSAIVALGSALTGARGGPGGWEEEEEERWVAEGGLRVAIAVTVVVVGGGGSGRVGSAEVKTVGQSLPYYKTQQELYPWIVSLRSGILHV